MSRISLSIAAATLVSGIFLCGAASAQTAPETGIYGVVRAGVSINPDQKFGGLSDGSSFDDKTKFKSGFQGEVGAGYDFGMFRLEQTIGYSQTKPKASAGYGRNRAFNMMVSGFVDIPTGTIVTPYVGVGAGIARVDARLGRGSGPTASSYDGKDYGLLWQASAGIGVKVAPRVTLEVGGRYTQTSMLKFDGVSDGEATTFKPKLRNISGTSGIRYVF